jgi:hypothetical protein
MSESALPAGHSGWLLSPPGKRTLEAEPPQHVSDEQLAEWDRNWRNHAGGPGPVGEQFLIVAANLRAARSSIERLHAQIRADSDQLRAQGEALEQWAEFELAFSGEDCTHGTTYVQSNAAPGNRCPWCVNDELTTMLVDLRPVRPQGMLDDPAEHFPWHYTEFGIVCVCGSPMDSDENCLSDLASAGKSGEPQEAIDHVRTAMVTRLAEVTADRDRHAAAASRSGVWVAYTHDDGVRVKGIFAGEVEAWRFAARFGYPLDVRLVAFGDVAEGLLGEA